MTPDTSPDWRAGSSRPLPVPRAGRPGRTAVAFLPFLLALFVGVLVAGPSTAHRIDESYVYFDVTEDVLSGRFEVALHDLDVLLNVDADGDGTVTDAELAAEGARVFNYMAPRLELEHGGRRLGLQSTGIGTLDARPIGVFAQIGFRVTGLESVPGEITVLYDPLAEIAPTHSGFILIGSNARIGLEENEAYVSLAFYGGDDSKRLSLAGEPWAAIFTGFVVQGFWHFVLGLEHVLFLLLLLLPSVMTASGGRWEPAGKLDDALWNVAGIVAIYTFSHSLALNLVGLEILRLPGSLVGPLVALSIVVAALMNLVPRLHRHLQPVVFGFGLVHGFGFGLALLALPPAPGQEVVSLAGFNTGLELGQIAIVAVAFPILWLVRRWGIYRLVAVRLGSLALLLLASTLLLERTTDFEFDARATIAMLTGIGR